MLIHRKSSLLLIVDAQEKLLPHIHEGQQVADHCEKLLKAAGHLDVPSLITEHYPQGLGKSVPSLRTLVPEANIASKIHFSAVKEGCLQGLNGFDRQQVVVCGAEAHVCVLQTVLDLITLGKEVFLVIDAVGSRTLANRDLGVQRMAHNGAELVSTEMVLFEWLVRAGTESFRTILKNFIR